MGSLPAPDYATTSDLDFNEILEPVIPIDVGGGSPATNLFIPWDTLTTADQHLVTGLIADYAGSPSLPIPVSAGYHTINVKGSAGGSPVPTGLDATQEYTLNVTTSVASGSPLGTSFVDTVETVTTSAITFDVLVSDISSGLSDATCTIVGGDLRITNDFTGAGADIKISLSGSLFASGLLTGYVGLRDPRAGVNGTLDVFALNRVNGTLGRHKIPFVKRGSRPNAAPGNDSTKAYYSGADWVRWIDDTAA